MSDSPAFTKVDGVLIPNKLLEYAKTLPKERRGTALNYYLIFGRQSAETIMEMLDKYQNAFCNRFPIDGLEKFIGTDEGEKAIFANMELYLSGKVMGVEKRIIFDLFKPFIHAYLDPAYILYSLSFRRPQAYKVLLATPGSFEWVRQLSSKVRERYGMADPALLQYMMEPWEMKALYPASAAVKPNAQK